LITQGIKISCKHKKVSIPSLWTAMIQMQKVRYVKYCKIVRKCTKDAMKQHYTRLIALSNNTIKTKLNIMKRERERDRKSRLFGI